MSARPWRKRRMMTPRRIRKMRRGLRTGLMRRVAMEIVARLVRFGGVAL